MPGQKLLGRAFFRPSSFVLLFVICPWRTQPASQGIIPSMDSQTISFRSFLPSILALMLIGWGGLFTLLYDYRPYVWARWGFFVLGILALTGTALPIIYFLHRRFPSDPPAEAHVITRQAIWVGVYGATLAWLQLGRLVTLYVILGLASGFIAAEYFIRMREKARRRLPLLQDDDPA